MPRATLALAALWLGAARAEAPILAGPYATAEATMHVPGLALNETEIDIIYASNATRCAAASNAPAAAASTLGSPSHPPTPRHRPSPRRPLRPICFAHGAGGGLFIQPIVYHSLLHALAAWGYVVVAPRACLFGICPDDDYWVQVAMTVDWARAKAAAGHPILSKANFSGGVGVAGHSMGGKATLHASEAARARRHGLVAAVMIHAFTFDAGPPAIPFLAFTGTTDRTAPMAMTERFYAAAAPSVPRGLVEKTGPYATHQEPSDWHDWDEPYNPRLAQFVAGWFKLFLDRVRSQRRTPNPDPSPSSPNGRNPTLTPAWALPRPRGPRSGGRGAPNAARWPRHGLLPNEARLRPLQVGAGESAADGVDWDATIFGSGPLALCGGGDGAMARCEVHRGNASAL